jgi:predicted nucleic acid-binding protein
MMPLIPDASVGAKWCLPVQDEPLAAEALALLHGYEKGEVQFVVPDIFWAELGNVLWKAVRRGRCTQETAESALSAMRERAVPTVSSAQLVNSALAIACAFDRTLYDCLYVALAVQSKGHFVTADQRLANALAAHLPVKWLGAP